MKLTEKMIHRPVTVFMVILAILLTGVISYSRLSLDYLPDTSSQWISITVRYPNMSPYTIEEIINKPIEEKISEIGGIKNLYSIASEGEGKVNVEFSKGTDIKRAMISVRQKLEMVRNYFPREANEPEIARYNPSETPIYIVSLKGGDLNALRNLAENYIKPKLERIEGISNISVGGGKLREIEVRVDLPKLKAYLLTVNDVIESLQSANIALPLGKIASGERETGVTLDGKIKKVAEIGEIGILNKENKIIKLKNVVDIKDGVKEKESIARENSEEVISIYVQKAGGANTILISKQIEQTFQSLYLPSYVKKEVSYQQAEYIEEALDKVKETGYLGAVIAMLVIFCFLKNLRNMFAAGFSIPLSVFMTLNLMYLFDVQLNMMTLSAMVLGIGIVVDNSIVVLDSIQQKKEVLNGLRQVLLPVTASTLTNMVVFLPLLLVDPAVRMVYGSFCQVIVFSLLSSLFVALLIVPALMKNLGEGKAKSKMGLLFGIGEKFRKLDVMKKYQKILLSSFRNKGKVFLGVFFLFLTALFCLFLIKEKTGDLLSSNNIKADIHFQSGVSLNRADKVTNEIEKELKSMPWIKKVTSKVEKEKSSLSLEISGERKESRSYEELTGFLNKKYEGFKEATVRFSYGEESQEANELTLEIYGDQILEMKAMAKKLAAEISQAQGVQNILYRFKEPRPEIQIIADKTLVSRHGLDVMTLSQSLKTYLGGSVAGKYLDDEKQVDIVVKLKEEQKTSISQIQSWLISSRSGLFSELSQLADIREENSESKIWRKNKRRMLALSIYLEVDVLKGVKEIEKIIQNQVYPQDISVEIDESFKEAKEKKRGMIIAVFFALLLVFMVLASLYESLVLPFVIISSVPLAFTGVIIYLFVFQIPMNFSVYIGLLILTGIVVNNGVVLVDSMKKNAALHRPLIAILLSTRSRLRPVMMTSFTTVFSLLPLALRGNAGEDIWASIAQVIIVGLICSAFLIFIIIPLLFGFLYREKRSTHTKPLSFKSGAGGEN